MTEEVIAQRVTPRWVADCLGLPSEDVVYREARLGRIPHKRLGRRVLFYRDAVEAFRDASWRPEPADRFGEAVHERAP